MLACAYQSSRSLPSVKYSEMPTSPWPWITAPCVSGSAMPRTQVPGSLTTKYVFTSSHTSPAAPTNRATTSPAARAPSSPRRTA
ncbi:hypothetical protein SAMN05428938_1168 [Streptomyces sp. KS_5]|nr:hypothetical protein SAMN05428938_1168 [Streptomyces sp. KS_5]